MQARSALLKESKKNLRRWFSLASFSLSPQAKNG